MKHGMEQSGLTEILAIDRSSCPAPELQVQLSLAWSNITRVSIWQDGTRFVSIDGEKVNIHGHVFNEPADTYWLH